MPSRILAVVTTKRESVAGGAPIFVTDNKEQLQQTAFILEKVLDAMVHELNEETLIIVRH
jgi:hypothetical protein